MSVKFNRGGQPDKFSLVLARAGVPSKVIACNPDEVIYHDGERAECIYQVVRGAVRNSKHYFDGHRRILAFHFPGQVFGLETGSTYCSAAKATTRSTVRLVKRSSIERAADLDPQVACALWSMTADNLRRTMVFIELLGQKAASKRLLNFLLEMEMSLSAMGEVELPMSRRDIADYLGLRLETVSRIFTRLEKQRILAFPGERSRRIVILNPALLRSMNV